MFDKLIYIYISCATVYPAPGITKRSLYDSEIHPRKESSPNNYYFISRGRCLLEISKKEGRTGESERKERAVKGFRTI